jgi:hypothetical protein
MKLAFAAAVACFAAVRSLRHRERWARALAPVRELLGRFWAYLMAEPASEPVTPQAVAAHPAVKAAMTGPVPADGAPLSDEEERILGRIEMDAMITIPEPADGSDR